MFLGEKNECIVNGLEYSEKYSTLFFRCIDISKMCSILEKLFDTKGIVYSPGQKFG